MVAQATQIHTTTHLPSATSAKVEQTSHSMQMHVATSDTRTKEPEQNKLSPDQMSDLTHQLNQKAQTESLSVVFGFDRELNQSYISVIDKDSGREIRKLPSEDALKFAKSMKESLGRLLDRRG